MKNQTNRIYPLKPFAFLLFFLCLGLSVLCGNAVAYTGSFDIEGKTITDQNGRNITVEKPFSRIISLYGAHTENLFALGLDTEIIGVTPNEVYPPEALKKPTFSYREDFEKFLAAGPDLVLIRPMIDRGCFQLINRLEKSGITVVSLQPSTVEEMFVYWRILGILTGKADRAAEMIAGFEKAVGEIKAVTETISLKKRVYFEAIHSRMKTFSPDSVAIFALETAGGINVATDAEPSRGTNIAIYGKERILSKGEAIDVYLAQTGTMNRPDLETIVNEPGFSAIRAVREKNIHFIDEVIVSRPTLRLIRGIREIREILYPEVFE